MPPLPPLAVSLSEMTSGDLPEVMRIERESFAQPWSESFFERELALQFSRTFLARAAGTPERAALGYVVVWFIADELHVLNLAVSPEHRRRGVARRLMDRVIEERAKAGANQIVLEVRRSGAAAQALYASLGFKPVGVRPRYYADNQEDAIIMVREG